MKLYFCEKPSQAADIAPHVGARRRCDGYFEGEGAGGRVVVTFAVGHLLEQFLPDAYKPELKQWRLESLPFVPNHNDWKMGVVAKTSKQFHVVQGLLKQATSVVIATDADREGELIAHEVMDYCGYRGTAQRLWLSALDDASVKKALANLLPASKTVGMAYAGLARQRADWAAGLNLTRALTVAFAASGKENVLNCGRVQTPVMALVVRRERTILGFKPTPFYTLDAQFEMAGSLVPMRWVMPLALTQQQGEYAGTVDTQGRIVRRSVVERVALKVSAKTGRVTTVSKTAERTLAPLLYSLSSIQQEASKRYGMKPALVLDVCQSLYEKHKATSYPRTDCEHLPESMKTDIPRVLDALASASGAGDLLEGFDRIIALARQGAANASRLRAFNDKKVTAHHAIIPTFKQGVDVAAMCLNERRIYDLVRRRYVAQLLGDYTYEQTDVVVVCEGETFTARGAVPIAPGWKLCYPTTKSNEASQSEVGDEPASAGDEGAAAKKNGDTVVLPAVREGLQAHNKKATVCDKLTVPPKRYTEGTLLGAMEAIDKEIEDPRFKLVMKNKEKAGIGTDATRASIIQGLFDNRFLEHHAKSKKDIVPTSKANEYIAILEQVAPSITDPVLTAMWEEQFSAVEKGTLTLEQCEGGVAQWVGQCVASIKLKAQEGIKVGAVAVVPPRKTAASPRAAAPRAPTTASNASSVGSPLVAAGQNCPSCSKGKTLLKPSSKYEGKYMLVCSERGCNFFSWPKT